MRLLLSATLPALLVQANAEQQPLTQPAAVPAIQRITKDAWAALNDSVDGRLHANVPFAAACFASFNGQEHDTNSEECLSVRKRYTDEKIRTSNPAAFIETQWETCQNTQKACLLDQHDPSSTLPTSDGRICSLGSISEYYIDVRSAKDVQAAFSFSKTTGVPLVIKNTGHDYKGRSSAPHSLSLWTHNLKGIEYEPKFVPTCPSSSTKQIKPVTAVTLEAGVQWVEVYTGVAAEYNLTVVGGADRTVGTTGGWLQGGGHSALSNTLGLGADRVLEFTVVTPDGELRIANQCQNKDLFFALRGGGGGTFGVVLSATYLASPQMHIDAVLIQFPPHFPMPAGFDDSVDASDELALTRSLFKLILDNSVQWAEHGWGAYINANSALYLTPALNSTSAPESMKPLLDWGKKLQKAVDESHRKDIIVASGDYPSWSSFFSIFADDNSAGIGEPLALSSRLIPTSVVNDTSTREDLLDALIDAERTSPGVRLLKVSPFNYKSSTEDPEDPYSAPSAHPAWRSTIFHATTANQWNWNSTAAEIQEHYKTVHRAMEGVRKVAGHAAYMNEADVYEENWQEAFFGSNYDKLLAIKNKYDPNHLLDCWQCVGWNRDSPRYSCYLDAFEVPSNSRSQRMVEAERWSDEL
ncbi:hypothetical protein M422DRAFT_170983 [Sphaerobolus stellatus SS14]|uniref:FAD-binding PCMH-type domain-containing protein n=1 Tax=Sphaerobolus stellatus (strain SS14) TaxID=990650 RepID=A0A0C9VW45_SPHS4|nr:hypothetical protein M422DRAFT_170983 [Sphaerobolus stellatus SS14]